MPTGIDSRSKNPTKPHNPPHHPKMKLSRSSFILGTSLAAMLLSYTGVQAAGIWDGTTGNYDDAINWDNDAVPGAINVNVSNNGTVIINTNHTTNDILTGTDGASTTSTWQHDAGVVTMGGGWFRMGTVANAGGTYNLNGGTLAARGQINIGEANGTSGATATLNIAGGTFTNTGATDRQNIVVGGRLNLANAGKGVLNISAGQLDNSSELWIGAGTGSQGVMNISGGTVKQAHRRPQHDRRHFQQNRHPRKRHDHRRQRRRHVQPNRRTLQCLIR